MRSVSSSDYLSPTVIASGGAEVWGSRGMRDDGKGFPVDYCVTCYTLQTLETRSVYILCMGSKDDQRITTFGYCEKHVTTIIDAFKRHALRPMEGGGYADECLVKRIGMKGATFL